MTAFSPNTERNIPLKFPPEFVMTPYNTNPIIEQYLFLSPKFLNL